MKLYILHIKNFPAHLIAFFVFILLPLVYFSSAQDPEQMPRLIALSVFLALVSIIILIKWENVNLNRNTVRANIILLLMLGWTGLSMLKSINAGDALTEWLRLAILFAFFFYASLVFKNDNSELLIITSWYAAIAIFIFSGFAIFQAITGWKSHGMFGYNFANTVWSLFSNKNFFSECLLLTIPFLVYGLKENKIKIFFILALIFNFSWILILKSSATWVALSGASAIYFFLFTKGGFMSKRNRITLFVICFLSAGSIFFIGIKSGILNNKFTRAIDYLRNPHLISVTSDANNNSTYERMMLWRNSIHMISDHPLMGVGLNNWKILNPSYGIGGTQFTNTGLIVYEHPHNDYLLVIAEQGPVGLILYLAFFVFVLVSGIRIFRAAEENQKYFIGLLICGIIAFGVISLFSYPRSRVYEMILLLMLISMLFSFSKSDTKAYRKLPLLFILMLSLIGICVFSYRLLSEIHARKMIYAQVHTNFPRMYREAEEANSWLFPVDISTTPIRWYMGMSRFYENDMEGAMGEYEMAVKINPYHLRTLNDLATTYERTGRRNEAIEYYRRALQISPLFIEGNLNLGAAYFNSGNIDSAYYYINRINGLSMSWQEENNQKLFLKVITSARDSLMRTNTKRK
jgi:O-antigen ligase